MENQIAKQKKQIQELLVTNAKLQSQWTSLRGQLTKIHAEHANILTNLKEFTSMDGQNHQESVVKTDFINDRTTD